MPHGHFGDILLDGQRETVEDMAEALQPELEKPVDDIEVNLRLPTKTGEVRLTGWLRGCYQSGPVRYRPAKLKGTDILRTGIEHIACCASSATPQETLFVSTDEYVKFRTIHPADAINQLTTLIEHYQEGLNRPLAFFPLTAWAWLKQDNEEKAEAAAQKAFCDTWQQRGDAYDSYISRVYPVLEPDIYNNLTTLASSLMLPLKALIKDVDQEVSE